MYLERMADDWMLIMNHIMMHPRPHKEASISQSINFYLHLAHPVLEQRKMQLSIPIQAELNADRACDVLSQHLTRFLPQKQDVKCSGLFSLRRKELHYNQMTEHELHGEMRGLEKFQPHTAENEKFNIEAE